MSQGSDTSHWIVFEFVDQFLDDLEAGAVRPLAHYLSRYPGHEEEVAREYFDLVEARAPAIAPGIDDTPGTVQDRRIGPYRVLRELGRGGQGTVLLAEDVRLGRRVALKVLTSLLGSVSEMRRNRFLHKFDEFRGRLAGKPLDRLLQGQIRFLYQLKLRNSW